jgi:hypothetical protein
LLKEGRKEKTGGLRIQLEHQKTPQEKKSKEIKENDLTKPFFDLLLVYDLGSFGL